MATPEEIEKSKQVEAELNRVSEGIIGIFPWGQFYGLMKGASNAGDGMIKHKICFDKDGYEVQVAKGVGGKFVKTFIKPAHEEISQSIARKKYGRAALGIGGVLGLTPGGEWIFKLRDQFRSSCLEVTPNTFLDAVEYRRQHMSWFDRNKQPIIVGSIILSITALSLGVVYLRNK